MKKRSSKSNMNRSINRVQSNILLTQMVENPDLAKGCSTTNKKGYAKFWKKLAEDLSLAGPPYKSEIEWKKVWSDQKRYVRKKVELNMRHKQGGKGAPPNMVRLSPSEEAICALIDMKADETEDSNDDSISFGDNHEHSSSICTDVIIKEENSVSLPDEMVYSPTYNEEMLQTDENIPAEVYAVYSANDEPTDNHNGIHMQAKLFETLNKTMEMFTTQQIDLQSSTKRINKTLQHLTKLKGLELQEMKRHNAEIEKLKRMEVDSLLEKNRIIIELEEMRSAILLLRNS